MAEQSLVAFDVPHCYSQFVYSLIDFYSVICFAHQQQQQQQYLHHRIHFMLSLRQCCCSLKCLNLNSVIHKMSEHKIDLIFVHALKWLCSFGPVWMSVSNSLQVRNTARMKKFGETKDGIIAATQLCSKNRRSVKKVNK